MSVPQFGTQWGCDVTKESQFPLVTLALLAYNQEKYIREAVEAALAQDYPNLEIIISDDCSSDRTFEIIQEIVRTYRGPHSVVLNRNAKNLNIGGHVNTVNRLASGELVVAAAGDDVSLPERVSRLVNAWLASNKEAGLLHSACRVITAAGAVEKDLGCPCLDALVSAEATAAKNAFVIGATEAWTKAIFDCFGDFRADLVHEDCALPFRTLLAGRTVMYVDQPLVLYRQSVGVSSRYAGSGSHMDSSQRKTVLKRLRIDAEQKLDDLLKRPNSGLEKIVMDRASRYDVAIRFEEGLPGPLELTRLSRRVGFFYVARMVTKRIVNFWRDGR